MKRLLFPLIILVALSLVATFVFQAVSGPPKMLQMPEGAGITPQNTLLPKVKADLDFGKLNEAELTKLVEALAREPDQPRHIKGFSVILAPGESLITEGFEKEPGVFEFSQMNAEVSNSDGTDAVLITAKRFQVSLDGEVTTLSMPRILTLPGVAATFQSVIRDQSGAVLEGFELDVTSEIVDGGISLQGNGVGH